MLATGGFSATLSCHKLIHSVFHGEAKSSNIAYVYDHCPCWETVWIEACSEAALRQVYSALHSGCTELTPFVSVSRLNLCLSSSTMTFPHKEDSGIHLPFVVIHLPSTRL